MDLHIGSICKGDKKTVKPNLHECLVLIRKYRYTSHCAMHE